MKEALPVVVNYIFAGLILGTIILGITIRVKNIQYTEETRKKGLKLLGWIVCLVVLFIINCNDNQNPTPFIQRIFKPIGIGSGTFYYASIIYVIGVLYALGKISRILNIRWLDQLWKRVLFVMIISQTVVSCQENVMKMYIGRQEGVDAIYMNRDKSRLWTDRNENDGLLSLTLSGSIDVENLAKAPRNFSMKVTVPLEYQELFGTEWITVKPKKGDFYEIDAKWKKDLEFVVTLEMTIKEIEEKFGKDAGILNGSSGRTSEFEVILYDENTEAYFQMEHHMKRMYAIEKKQMGL